MSWTIERRGRVAVVAMTTNPVNAQNQAFSPTCTARNMSSAFVIMIVVP